MHSMQPIGGRTGQGEPRSHDCMVHALDNIDHPLRSHVDQISWATVRLPHRSISGSHESKDRPYPAQDFLPYALRMSIDKLKVKTRAMWEVCFR